MLSNSTVAYQRALMILESSRILEPSRPDSNVTNIDLTDSDASNEGQISQKSLLQEMTTANLRRASRRGFHGDRVQSGEPETTVPDPGSQLALAAIEPDRQQSRVLSHQEITELEHVISKNPPRASRSYNLFQFSDEENLSWLLGLLAGFATFGAILILFF